MQLYARQVLNQIYIRESETANHRGRSGTCEKIFSQLPGFKVLAKYAPNAKLAGAIFLLCGVVADSGRLVFPVMTSSIAWSFQLFFFPVLPWIHRLPAPHR